MRLGRAEPEAILPHELAWRHLLALPAGEGKTMSDRTHAEFMRSILHSPWGPDLPEYRERFDTIAKLLDAMQWRDKPPDSEGDWVRDRSGKRECVDVFVDRLANIHFVHESGDLWFKPPEVTK